MIEVNNYSFLGKKSPQETMPRESFSRVYVKNSEIPVIVARVPKGGTVDIFITKNRSDNGENLDIDA